MILGGFFLHEEVNEKVDAGESHALGIESYDPVNKEFITNWYQFPSRTPRWSHSTPSEARCTAVFTTIRNKSTMR
jgi:hypothetical protein